MLLHLFRFTVEFSYRQWGRIIMCCIVYWSRDLMHGNTVVRSSHTQCNPLYCIMCCGVVQRCRVVSWWRALDSREEKVEDGVWNKQVTVSRHASGPHYKHNISCPLPTDATRERCSHSLPLSLHDPDILILSSHRITNHYTNTTNYLLFIITLLCSLHSTYSCSMMPPSPQNMFAPVILDPGNFQMTSGNFSK